MFEMRWVEVSDMEFENIGGAFVECKRSRWLESVPVKLQFRSGDPQTQFNDDGEPIGLGICWSEWQDVPLEEK